MKLNSRKSSLKGKRTQNQDVYSRDDKRGIYILADGMGGASGGQEASRFAIQIAKPEILTLRNKTLKPKTELEAEMYGLDNASYLLGEIISYTNEVLSAIGSNVNTLKNLGTTLDVCVILDKKLILGHVGDSSIYLIDRNAKTINKLTEEHAPKPDNYEELSSLEKHLYMSSQSGLSSYVGKGNDITIDVKMIDLPERFYIVMGTDGFNVAVPPSELLEITTEYDFAKSSKILRKLSARPSENTISLYQKHKIDLNSILGDNSTFIIIRGDKDEYNYTSES